MLPPTRLSCFALVYGSHSLASSAVLLSQRTKQGPFPPTALCGVLQRVRSWTPVFCTHPAGPKSKQKQKGTMPPIYRHRNGLNTTCHVSSLGRFSYSWGRAQITPSFPKQQAWTVSLTSPMTLLTIRNSIFKIRQSRP